MCGTVKYSCFGCSLRTGTLIILWFGVVFSSFGIFCGTSSGVNGIVPFSEIWAPILVMGIFTSFNIAGIYGVVMERPSLLIPYLGFQALLAMILMVIWIGCLYMGLIFLTDFIIPPNESDRLKEYFHTMATILILSFGFVSFIFDVIIYYFFIVVLSFCMKLKRDREIFQC